MYDPKTHAVVIEKYVQRFSYNTTERDDLRQELSIAVWRAGEIEDIERFVADAAQSIVQRIRPQVMELPFFPNLHETSPPKSEWELVSTERLYKAFIVLNVHEREIVEMIFGLGRSPTSMKKIAKQIGRTEWWVRKHKKSALRKMKGYLEKHAT